MQVWFPVGNPNPPRARNPNPPGSSWGRLGCNSRMKMHSASPPPKGSRGETPRTPPSAALGFPLRSAYQGKPLGGQTAECICNLELQPSHSDPQSSLGQRACRVHLQSAIAAEHLSAAIAESRLQLQNLSCNCRFSAAIAGRSAAFVGGSKVARLQFQIANAPCSLPAQGKLDPNGSAAIADCKCTLQDLCPKGKNALFTPLGCSGCLKLQMVELQLR